MLVSLHVKNLALIDETEVYFKEGLNILSGETGAGKSIIIGSVNLALGAKADKDMIRTNADYALVELIFQIEDKKQLAQIEELDIPVEEDNMLIIQRKIMPARTVCKVNGETVSAKQLQQIAQIMIDIHGQHEHQSLLYKKKHFEILDNFAGEKLSHIKEEIQEQYNIYQELKNELEDAVLSDEAREREMAFVTFEIDEIENAHLQMDEDEALEQSYAKMTNSRKIIEAVSMVHNLTGYESGTGAGETLGRALRELRGVVAYDKVLEELETQLSEIDAYVNDFNRDIANYMSDMEFDEADFEQTRQRLNEINTLKAKYGSSISEILEYKEQKQQRLYQLEDYVVYIAKLQNNLEKTENALDMLCAQASSVRKEAAMMLAKTMTEALKDLNFLDVQFEIVISKLGKFTKTGYDDVEFMISTNPGEPVKPLGNVASGGELSRIMLAIKTVLAKNDTIDTLIFDEIDTGISGKTAWKVSQKLGLLGRTHQIICITHLPQIAAMADVHFLIEKSSESGVTTTQIYEIEEEDIIRELARLSGGMEMTETVLQNAREMKDLATNTKQY
ncbi:MAG: DNA repair protein RecN [Lachnospiraceae bacterium]|nr:DNA repair protein RecN [Lachnospiraceae bacterium]